jgi:signal transduction histidine kinase/ActR/RegA family two-component response regulator
VDLPDSVRIVRTRTMTSRLPDVLLGLAIAVGTAILFTIDITQPRGVVDGVGYAAVVALTSRFGQRPLMASAALTSILTIVAAALLPDSGISVAGMWANRAFALAEIWIVALVMHGRMALERLVRQREHNQRRHEAALASMLAECLLANIGFDERLAGVCAISARALGIDAGLVSLRNNDNKTATILHSWRLAPKKQFAARGDVVAEDQDHKAKLAREFVVAYEDVGIEGFGPEMKKRIRDADIRAVIAAEIFMGAPRTGTIAFGRQHAHRWSAEEIAFARAVASFVGILISAQRNSETLAALELTDDGIYTEDASGKVQYFNRAARMFARPLPEGDEFPKPSVPLTTAQDQHEIHFEGRDLEIHRARLPAGGQIVRLADVTERHKTTAERTRLEDRLQQAAKLEAIGQLAGGMAHDFNNILGAVSGFAGFIMQDTAIDSQNREFAQRILSASRRGKEMVDQIMAFAETRAIAFGVANLSRCVRATQEMLATAMHPGAMLEVELAQASPLLVRGNEVQIGQLITNLATNGRDALNGSGGLVEISADIAAQDEIERMRDIASAPNERLVGELQASRRYARLSVSDSGAGIPPQLLDRIFEPFFSTKGRQRGTGLGLAVVHGVVRAHDGFCHVRSEAGKGTVFSVYLPLLDEPVGRVGISPDRLFHPCRVLIVDDEADMADMLSIGLERLGFQTVAVQNPLVALAAIEEDPSAFDALLSDQLMPGMQGTELIREAKRAAPGLRAVLYTAHAEKMSTADALAQGADAVLYKPVDIQEVAQTVSAPLASNPQNHA